MARVLLAHIAEDMQFAEALATALGHRGHTVLRGDRSSLGRVDLLDDIGTLDAIVFILSPAASESSWLSFEAGTAASYFKQRGKPLVVPLAFSTADVHPPLSQFQYLVVRDRDPETAVATLEKLLADQLARVQAAADERRALQDRVESTAARFIQESLHDLGLHETRYRRIAYACYATAYATLGVTALFAVWRISHVDVGAATWQSLLGLAIGGTVALVLLLALAKYAFGLGKSFMVEALRNADRRHAISFGEFYLKAFGEKASWQEVKDAFQHWNIDSGSYFIRQDARDFDPKIVELALGLARAASGRLPKQES